MPAGRTFRLALAAVGAVAVSAAAILLNLALLGYAQPSNDRSGSSARGRRCCPPQPRDLRRALGLRLSAKQTTSTRRPARANPGARSVLSPDVERQTWVEGGGLRQRLEGRRCDAARDCRSFRRA